MSKALELAEKLEVPNTDSVWAAAAELRRLDAVEAELEALKRAISEAQPEWWIREWAHNGETPKKEKNENGRLAWPWKFKLLPVTQKQTLPSDLALYTLKGIK